MIDLTDFNNELLNFEILAEEAAEVIEEVSITLQMHNIAQVLSRIVRIKSKINRFGLNDFHSKNKIPNKESLEQEIGHFFAMVEILIENKTLSRKNIKDGRIHKFEKLSKWYKQK